MIAYCPICNVDREMPDDLLAGFAQAPALLDRALAQAQPPHDGWTPREVLAHLADSEVNFGARVRTILSDDEPLVPWYDEERWHDALFYAARDQVLDLATFRAVRASNVDLLSRIDAAAWHRGYIPGSRPPVRPLPELRHTLEELVRHRADHDLQHLAQIAGGAP